MQKTFIILTNNFNFRRVFLKDKRLYSGFLNFWKDLCDPCLLQKMACSACSCHWVFNTWKSSFSQNCCLVKYHICVLARFHSCVVERLRVVEECLLTLRQYTTLPLAVGITRAPVGSSSQTTGCSTISYLS